VAFVNSCRFTPTAGGTTDWTYSAVVPGFQSPAAAGATNALPYSVRAESADGTQWEDSQGNYNSATGTFARTTVLYNSSGTGTGAGQTGAGTKISFSTVPQVQVVCLAEDLRAFAPLVSAALTGTPTAPTAAANNNSTQIATTAYADAIAALKANLTSPTFTGVPAAPTAAVDTNTTQLATTAMVLAQAASVAPLIDGAATVGTSTRFARQDHIHPTDTSRAPLASPTFTGVPAAPTAAANNNSTQIATTAYVDAGMATITGGTF
jgi:hypothetical protein